MSTVYPENCVILAPLSGYTDLPFRQSCRRQGCLFAFAPLIDANSVVYQNSRNRKLLVRGDDEPWLGVQLVGGNPQILAQATERINDYNFDLLDLNMGCPMPKVTRKGAGAALSHDPVVARQCVEEVVKVSRFPVTAKIRIVSESDPDATVQLALGLQDAGICALTIHGRMWEKIYAGPVAMDVIGAVRDALRIPVIANGGIFSDSDAQTLRECTGCSRIMVARGSIGNPWLFRELDTAKPVQSPSHDEICAEVEQQVLGMIELYGEDTGMRQARKIILAYLTGRGYRRTRRSAVTQLATENEFREFLDIIRIEGPSPKFHV